MANRGWYDSDEWQRLERPLLELDDLINEFASQTGLVVSKNHKDIPERSLVWGEQVRCLIQIYLADEKTLTFNVWLCAYHDDGSQRYWKHETPVKGRKVAEFKDELASLLNESYTKLVNWSNKPDEFSMRE